MVFWAGAQKLHMRQQSRERFVNRGFLNGPICPIYGVGVTVVVYFLTPYKDNLILLYALSTVLVTVLEGLTGYLMDKIFHHKWWGLYKSAAEYRWICLPNIFPCVGSSMCTDCPCDSSGHS